MSPDRELKELGVGENLAPIGGASQPEQVVVRHESVDLGLVQGSVQLQRVLLEPVDAERGIAVVELRFVESTELDLEVLHQAVHRQFDLDDDGEHVIVVSICLVEPLHGGLAGLGDLQGAVEISSGILERLEPLVHAPQLEGDGLARQPRVETDGLQPIELAHRHFRELQL